MMLGLCECISLSASKWTMCSIISLVCDSSRIWSIGHLFHDFVNSNIDPFHSIPNSSECANHAIFFPVFVCRYLSRSFGLDLWIRFGVEIVPVVWVERRGRGEDGSDVFAFHISQIANEGGRLYDYTYCQRNNFFFFSPLMLRFVSRAQQKCCCRFSSYFFPLPSLIINIVVVIAMRACCAIFSAVNSYMHAWTYLCASQPLYGIGGSSSITIRSSECVEERDIAFEASSDICCLWVALAFVVAATCVSPLLVHRQSTHSVYTYI